MVSPETGFLYRETEKIDIENVYAEPDRPKIHFTPKNGLLKSKNLTDWELFQKIELPGENECPDIFPIYDQNKTKKWVLMGARDMYVVGDFKNGEYVQCQEIRKLHYGEYVYAGQTVSNMPQGRTVRITWDRGCVKTDRICGEMNTPVELELVEKAGTCFLKATPVNEIETLFAEKTEYENISIKKDQPKKVNLKNSPYLLKLKGKKDKNVCIDIMLFDNKISCDFSKNHAVVNGESVPLAEESDSFEVVVVADTASIEVYFDGGISYAVMKKLYCANSPSNLKISSNYDYSVEKLEINELSSVWRED